MHSCSKKIRASLVIEKWRQRMRWAAAEAAWPEMAEVIGKFKGITT